MPSSVGKTPRRSVTIFLPVFNNSASLDELFRRLQSVEAAILKRGLGCEILFVEDGSRDDTFAKLVHYKSRLGDCKIIRHTRNFGAVTGWKTAARWEKCMRELPVGERQ